MANDIDDDHHDGWQQVLDELEALQAMYPNEMELISDDREDNVVRAARQRMERPGEELEGGEGYQRWTALAVKIRFSLSNPNQEESSADLETVMVELELQFPPGYPQKNAQATCRSSAFRPPSQKEAFQKGLSEHLSEACGSEGGSGFAAVQYVQDCVAEYVTWPTAKTTKKMGSNDTTEATQAARPTTRRIYVTFHHMLMGASHKKERAVRQAASSYDIQGHWFWGKPSVMVLEGASTDLDDFLHEASRAGKKGEIRWEQNDVVAAFSSLRGVQDCGYDDTGNKKGSEGINRKKLGELLESLGEEACLLKELISA